MKMFSFGKTHTREKELLAHGHVLFVCVCVLRFFWLPFESLVIIINNLEQGWGCRRMEPTERRLRRHLRTQLTGSLLTSADAPGTDESSSQTQRFSPGGPGLAIPSLRRVHQRRRSPTGTVDGHPRPEPWRSSHQHDGQRSETRGLPGRLLVAFALPVRRRPGTDFLPPQWHDIRTQIERLIEWVMFSWASVRSIPIRFCLLNFLFCWGKMWTNCSIGGSTTKDIK